jgi:ribosome-associated toxin RatA of RatAB toxin-antitoxin module
MATTMTHTRVIAAPAGEVYRLVADVTAWPVIFGPTVHVELRERDEREERFQLWALVGGDVATWVSRRALDPRARRITFRQERSHPPVTAMSGSWAFLPRTDGRTEVVLDHTFSVTEDDPGAVDRIGAAVDANSTSELAALARIAELGHPVGQVIDTFGDTVVLDARLGDVYDFVHRSDLWPARLPHVSRVDLTEDASGVQHMEMDTVVADGTTHTTRSIRVCAPNAAIAYKQLLPPKILLGHSGRWTFRGRGDGDGVPRVEVTAEHTVAIDPEAALAELGGRGGLVEARRYVREALGGNGRATLAHAGRYAGSTATTD